MDFYMYLRLYQQIVNNIMTLRSLFVLVVVGFSVAFAVSEKLQVHIVGHSHDDPGWLKTVDQYYTGNNASIYPASVQYIFDSVVQALDKKKDRKFTFCEISVSTPHSISGHG